MSDTSETDVKELVRAAKEASLLLAEILQLCNHNIAAAPSLVRLVKAIRAVEGDQWKS